MAVPNNQIRGLLNRTASLYNSKLYSNIEFHVRDNNDEVRVFYAHTVILASAGETFAQMFYVNNREPFEPLMVMGFTHEVFDLMLRYIYTEKIKFASLDDAMAVLRIARRYGVNDLLVECDRFLSQFQVDVDSVFAKYDCALLFRKGDLLRICRKLVSYNTKELFESPYFCMASRSVIEDMLRLNDLSIPCELDVIEAVLRWCRAECRRKNRIKDVYLRESFLPLCRNLRFLTLDCQEFLDFEERAKIFTSAECSQLTNKLLNKTDPKLKIPIEFCPSLMTRCSYLAADSKPVHETNYAVVHDLPGQSNGRNNVKQSSSNDNQIFKYSPQSNGASAPYRKKSNNVLLKELNPYPPSHQIFAQSNGVGKTNDPLLSFPPPSKGVRNIAPSNAGYPTTSSNGSGHITPPNVVRHTAPSNVGYHPAQSNGATYSRATGPKDIHTNSSSCKREAPQISSPKSIGEQPLYQVVSHKKNAPQLRVVPQSQQLGMSTMTYEIQLHEMVREISSCFENDIKCNAAVRMLRGTMNIHGIELRVDDLQTKNGDEDEEIEVHVCLTNGSPPKSYSQNVQLKNSVLNLPFSEPIRVDARNPLDIEVMIEELKLSRCGVCRLQQSRCELNSGLGVTAQIVLKSNQINGSDSFFFLIQKLHYSVPKY